MARQAIAVGFPSPVYISETGTRQAILPGEFLSETTSGGSLPGAPNQALAFSRFLPAEELDEPGLFPPRRAAVAVAQPSNEAVAFGRFRGDVEEDDTEFLSQIISRKMRSHGTAAAVLRPQVSLIVT